ncbi:hypothetical protein OMK64_17135, partial [Cellulomonas fimi]|uniref:hypothetical protein n=1 Tax=Cellulomonas fimi TaxID=1708 RepID=UPI00234DB611
MRRASLFVAAVCAAAMVVTGLVAVESATPAQAATASDFTAGNIISDALFFDGGAMGAGDVQAFLDAKRPTCTPGYTCLKSYTTATTDQPAEAGLCSAYTGRASETAAQVIANVGAACGISQRVLLVLLQKEQGLVTATAPTDARYRTATGFACPDTAPCDAQYYGFFNQVYRAARQFKRYAANPASYSYRAGRVNAVRFHPNTACGSGQVYIENQATAGLYIYTPYQPNASALGSLYGTGDSCASYGNRNFWRDYTDWFGSTQFGANLVRSAGDPAVYLLTATAKHHVQDGTILDSLNVLGGVAYVAQSVLDMRPTGAPLGRFFRGRDGSIWLFDKGWRFHVTDCAMLTDWGRDCGEFGSMTLADSQLGKFVDGGDLSTSYTTAEGSWFYVRAGVRHEVFDAGSLALAPVAPTTPTIHLRDAAGAALGIGAPLVRTGAVVRGPAGDGRVVDGGRNLAVSAALLTGTRLTSTLATRSLDPRSVAAMPAAAGTVSSVVVGPDGTRYGFTDRGTVRIDARFPASVTGPQVSAELVTALAPQTPAGPVFVRSTTAGDLFLAEGGKRRAVSSMDTVYALAAGGPVTVVQVEQAALDAIPLGGPVLTPGRVVKSAAGPDLFLVDGTSTLRHVV